MSDYLLPCSCGQKLPVSVRHAGHMIRCACGAQLEVPTLRGLRQLEPAEARPQAGRTWGGRQQLAFVLATVAGASLVVAAYLAIQLPVIPEPPAWVEVDQNTPTSGLFRELQLDLEAGRPRLTPAGRAITDRHDRMLWGIAGATVIGACTGVGAAVVLFGGRQKR
jgi:hypothetical protein